MYRTGSGRETYYPSGHQEYIGQAVADSADELSEQEITLPRKSVERERRASLQRDRPSWGSRESSSRFAPREAGRGA
jgi:hypothetical protein